MSEPLVALPDTDTLTPTQELVMEVLAARYRLGENTWTFGKRHGPALASLAYDGYIGYKSGVVPNTYLAWMTPEGRAAALDPDYVPPNVAMTYGLQARRSQWEPAAEEAKRSDIATQGESDA